MQNKCFHCGLDELQTVQNEMNLTVRRRQKDMSVDNTKSIVITNRPLEKEEKRNMMFMLLVCECTYVNKCYRYVSMYSLEAEQNMMHMILLLTIFSVPQQMADCSQPDGCGTQYTASLISFSFTVHSLFTVVHCLSGFA